jgi:hypothetical protein
VSQFSTGSLEPPVNWNGLLRLDVGLVLDRRCYKAGAEGNWQDECRVRKF